MVGLAVEVFLKCLAAFLVVAFSAYLFPDLLDFGESTMQATVVFAFYCYCFLALFCRTEYRLFHVLSIPIFTQFLHLFQKYSFPAGANSIWRLLPFLLLDSYFLFFLLRVNFLLPKKERLFILSWIVVNTGFLIISPNFTNLVLGGTTLFLITLPMYFIYLNHMLAATDFAPELEKYLFYLYLILGIGTFGLVAAGAIYKGSDNLLVTRNISDTNVTMAYFILLWPFALLYCARRSVNLIWISVLLLIFIAVVILSFSRGAVFVVTLYLILSIFCIFSAKQVRWFTVLLCLTLFLWPASYHFDDQNIGYSWNLRFGELQSFTGILERLQATSGRAEIHAIAYRLFLEKPIFGHGIGSFEVLGPGYREAHSLWYTLLAEQGLVGVLFSYFPFLVTASTLIRIIRVDRKYAVLLLGLIFYLLFVHTVGSVFVVIPAKSITINCIAPILLLCLYYYGQSILVASNPEDRG